MHAALDIPELLLNIFSYLNSSKDLYRCIRVCRSFSGPAVEVLWQNGPVPLQALLNQFGRRVLPIIPFRAQSYASSKLDFNRELVPSDWDPVLARGEKIRSLYYFENRDSLHHGNEWVNAAMYKDTRKVTLYPRKQIPRAFFHELAFHRPVFHILPNLEALEWTSDDLHCSLLFINPALKNLNLGSSEFTYPFLEEVRSRIKPGSGLESLTLSGKQTEDDESTPRLEYGSQLERLLDTLSGLKHIRLQRDFASSGVLLSLSRLPTLESLEIDGKLLEGVVVDYMSSLDPGGDAFPVLKTLCITITVNPKSFPCFLSDPVYISSPHLHTLKIVFHGNDATSVRVLFEGVASRWPDLRVFHLRPENDFYDFVYGDHKMRDLYQKPHYVKRIQRSFIDQWALEPLLSLHGLEELVIQWVYELQISGETLEKMAQALPSLTTLYLSPVPFLILPSRPKLHIEDMAALRGLRALRKLALFVDAVPRGDAPITGEPQMRLHEFDPGRSWINDSTFAAQYIAALFPRAGLLPELKNRKTRWGDVAHRLASQMP